MSNAPNLPPIYRPASIPSDAVARAEAIAAAKNGTDPATLFWTDRGDRAQCAVVLAPQQALRLAAQITVVGMTALGDALGATLPPHMVVGYLPTGTVLLNDAKVGTLDVIVPTDCSDDGIPEWLVVAIDIGIGRFAEGSEEAADLGITTFEDEGCMGIGADEVVGAFARYLLTWIDRWQKDGFAPARTSWSHRGPKIGQEIELAIGESVIAGRFGGLSDNGNVLIDSDNGAQSIPATALAERAIL